MVAKCIYVHVAKRGQFHDEEGINIPSLSPSLIGGTDQAGQGQGCYMAGGQNLNPVQRLKLGFRFCSCPGATLAG